MKVLGFKKLFLVILNSLFMLSPSLSLAEQNYFFEAKWKGTSSFFQGSDQYKVTYCEDEHCQNEISGNDVLKSAKKLLAAKILKNTNKQMRHSYYRNHQS